MSSGAATFSTESIDPAFANIAVADPSSLPQGKPTIVQLWRIENLQPIPVPESEHGKFYSGDSYICLVANRKGTSSFITYDIHFWLGSETTHDEMGAAALKTCELDASLGGSPVQYRETQAHESAKFSSLFKDKGGIMYLDGGVDSGFKHVKPGEKDFPTRLLQLKGRRNVRVKEVEASTTSLNDGDVFILDQGLTIFQFNGQSANRMEKAKGLEVCTRLKDDRGGKPHVQVIDSPADGGDAEPFWEALGGAGEIKTADEGGDDRAEEKRAKTELQLYKCSDASGEMKVEVVPKEGSKILRSSLATEDTFILDTGTALYAWVGKHCTAQEKRQALLTANQFIVDNNRPVWTHVSVVIEGGETPEFKAYFFQWDPPTKPRDWSQPMSSGVAKAVEQKEIDVNALVAGSAAATQMVDDGSGQVQVWRIENFQQVPVDESEYGQFYSGDSYIVLYTYTPKSRAREEYIIYFWQGKNSSTDEKGASALLATKMDDDLGGSPVQVRVVQGKEPAHFCALFKGQMTVHQGGKGSGFSNSDEGDEKDDDGVSLFHVKGTNENNTRAVQVDEVCASLNSGDCFVLLVESTVYVWCGNGSSETERNTAQIVGERLVNWNGSGREVVQLQEGEEPDEFWTPLGGKGEYANESELVNQPQAARLFQCSNVTGAVEVEEIFNFDQDDLIDEDVCLMDTYTAVYIWVGSQANSTEKRMASEIARKYNAAATDGRDPNTPIVVVQAGREPAMFTAHFLAWDSNKAETFVDPYEQRLQELRAKKSFHTTASWAKPAAAEEKEEPAAPESKETAPPAVVPPPAAASGDGTFTYEQLKGNPCAVQGQVDPKAKETYLSPEEFQQVFSMDRAAFDALPKWKRQTAKKKAGLF